MVTTVAPPSERASRGVSVRCLELIGGRTNIWRGVRGTVTIRSTRDEAQTLELASRCFPIPTRSDEPRHRRVRGRRHDRERAAAKRA